MAHYKEINTHFLKTDQCLRLPIFVVPQVNETFETRRSSSRNDGLVTPSTSLTAAGCSTPFLTGPITALAKSKHLHALSANILAIVSMTPVLTMSPQKTNSLAYAEMRLILARLLWSFELEMLPESKSWDQQKTFLLWDKGPIQVKVTAVQR